MTDNNSSKSKTATLGDLLEGPFELVAYGELFEGFKVVYDKLSQRMKERIEQIMSKHGIDRYPHPPNPADVQAWRNNFRDKYKEIARPCLATIHGYRHGGAVTVLPEPVLFLVIGSGKKCSGGGSIFPDGEYSMWAMDYPTIRCDLEGQDSYLRPQSHSGRDRAEQLEWLRSLGLPRRARFRAPPCPASSPLRPRRQGFQGT